MADLITPEYRATLQAMHKEQVGWAKSGTRFLSQICGMIDKHKPKTILDYGCGKGVLIAQLNQSHPDIVKDLYDPGIEKYSHDPKPADFVICTDVLEHIEPELINNVLEHLEQLTQKCAYFVIHTADCGHKLPDGRPAHLLQKPQSWWSQRISRVFKGCHIEYKNTGLPNRFDVRIERVENGTARH